MNNLNVATIRIQGNLLHFLVYVCSLIIEQSEELTLFN